MKKNEITERNKKIVSELNRLCILYPGKKKEYYNYSLSKQFQLDRSTIIRILAKEKNLNENYKSKKINTKYYFETIEGIF